MAGRSADKLAQVRESIGAPKDLPLIVADGADRASLVAMARRAKAIITTVGPYQLYGSELVAVCAETGTDYLDLCGEPTWMHAMIDKHEAQAKQSGARILFSCGFDSMPFELGVYLRAGPGAQDLRALRAARERPRAVDPRRSVRRHRGERQRHARSDPEESGAAADTLEPVLAHAGFRRAQAAARR